MHTLGSAPRWWRGRRAPLIRQAVALAVAAGAVAWALQTNNRAVAIRGAYGTLRRVAVARHPLAAGALLGAADVSWRDLPALALPADPAPNPVGRTTLAPIAAGQVLTSAQLSDGRARGLAALVPPGEQAVAVPLADHALGLAPGDRVEVVAPARDGNGTGHVVVRDAPVLQVGSGRVVLAVGDDEIDALADALAAGQPVIALEA